MQALVLTGPGQVSVRELPEAASNQDALVAIEGIGICGTDLSIFAGKIPVDYPRIMGHEATGVVREGDRLPAGTRVLIDPGISCGKCDLCLADKPNLCRNGGLLGRDFDGVFAELLGVDETLLHPLPETVSADVGPLLQVLGTCVHAQSRLETALDQVAVVVGMGVAGFLHLQLLRGRGLQVVAVTRSPWKKNLALELGAAAAVGPEEAAGLTASLSGGRGAGVVVECAGTERTLAHSIELAGAGATVIAFGTLTSGAEGLPYYLLYHKEIELWNPRAALPRDYDRAIRLVESGMVDLLPIVTHRRPWSEIPSFLAGDTKDEHLKTIFFPG